METIEQRLARKIAILQKRIDAAKKAAKPFTDEEFQKGVWGQTKMVRNPEEAAQDKAEREDQRGIYGF